MKRPNIKDWSVPAIALMALVSSVSPAFAQSGATERVSVTSDGAEANNSSDMSAISASWQALR
jgi:hypothetical protein